MRAANFVEETTTSIAGTNGNGAVTMTAVTGRPRFSTVFGTQATTVRYIIEDTTNGKTEVGIGSVASNVLTRTRPQITWDGTTYDDSTPSPIQFGSTPTTGNVRIRMAATAEFQGVVLPGVNTTIAGSADWRDYPITNNTHFNPEQSGDVVTVDRMYYSCYRLDVSGLLQGIQVPVTNAVASSGLKMALYSCGVNGLPDRKIVTFNTLDTATTGMKTDTTTGTWSPAGPVWLTAGWYYIGWISNGAITIRGSGSNTFELHRTPLGRHSGYGYGNTVYESGSYASGPPASPAPTTMLSASNGLSVPSIGMRVVP